MIHVLDKNTSDKIAAGEVIERPVSIVKELVENSVDAGARSITVEIRDGGRSFIRVSDDGCGIPREECETAFLRHATSKIEKAEDLDRIESLGFRGEALASIAAVTRVTMITRPASEDIGTKVVLHGGEVLENSGVGCPPGTTMVVTDLFYNTPARKQFLRAAGVEASRIIEFMSEYAICYHETRFRLINNGKVVFATTGSGSMKQAVLTVTGQRDYRGLVTVSGEDPALGLKLEGCISRPSLSRTTRKDQIFYVNGRSVKDRTMERGVTDGYRERLFPGRYPVVFLHLTTDPARVDVNIHPAKREVRFHDKEAIRRFLSDTIFHALAGEDAVIRAQDYYHEEKPKDEQKERRDSIQVDIRKYLEGKRASQTASFSGGHSSGASGAGSRKDVHAAEKEAYASSAFENAGLPISEEGQGAAPDRTPVAPETSAPAGPEVPEEKPAAPRRDPDDFDLTPAYRPFDIDRLHIIGSVFDTYILAEDGETFYMVDQHAAHERVFYEKLVGAYLNEKKLVQPILVPFTADVPRSAEAQQDAWLPDLLEMGFDAAPFGPGILRVTGIPAYMDIGEAERFLNDFIDQTREGVYSKNQVVIDKLITRSCKAAIKAHDKLSDQERQALFDQLTKCRNPFSCPHGRPTFIRFTRYEIEKFFKRIQ